MENPKFIGTEGFIWFFGVVEDNRDPAMLGRVKVRCFGYHTQDKSQLPTEDLPWANVVQPTTSAGLRGVGSSPTGLLIGTHVTGWFVDGVVAQIPLISGVIGGVNSQASFNSDSLRIPQSLRQQYASATPDELQAIMTRDNIAPTQSTAAFQPGELGTMTPADIQEFKTALGRRESGGSYTSENQYGFIGKYQFGYSALIDTGFVNSTYRTNTSLNVDAAWRGKFGVVSKSTWKSNGTAQESAMDDWMRIIFRGLIRNNIVQTSSDPRIIAGYIAVSHLKWFPGAIALRNGQITTDANGTSTREYYNLGYNSGSRLNTPTS